MNNQSTVRLALSTDAPAIAQVLVTIQELHADAHPETFKQPESVAAFLDEVQRLPSLLNEVQRFIEERRLRFVRRRAPRDELEAAE